MIDLSITAAKIARARREKAFTQEELGERLGVSPQAVSKWERGLSLPDIDLLLDLSKILDIPLNYLLDKESAPQNETSGISKDFFRLEIFNDIRMDPILIRFGVGLVPWITEDYIKRFSQIRKDFLLARGVLLPTIRLRDDARLENGRCVIDILSQTRYDRVFNPEDTGASEELIVHFTKLIDGELHRLINRHVVKLMVENAKETSRYCIDGVIPERLSLSKLKAVLKALAQKRYPINDLISIIDCLDDLIDGCSDTDELAGLTADALGLKAVAELAD